MEKYEIPFRPVYEIWAAISWFLGVAFMALLTHKTDLPLGPFLILGGAGLGMGIWRLVASFPRIQEHRSLRRVVLQFVGWKKFKSLANKKGSWIGEGFPWGQQEVEKASEILKKDPERILGKKVLAKGHQWIHGLGAKRSEPLYFPEDMLNGHTLVVGTTGSGKTRLYDLLIAQAILRGEAVFIIDPKGDHELRENARRICEAMGEPEKFISFHPGFPEKSARIDPLRNWNRPTEIASRISTLIPSETGADPFTAFGWMALNNIVNGLLAVDEQPNLLKLRRYLEGDPGMLVVRALRAHFEKKVKNWDTRITSYLKSNRGKEIEAYIQFYESEVANESPSPELKGLITSYTHNREHFQKMIASLIPILSMLTSGTLGDLLSPEADPDDLRPITDTSRIVSKGMVAYIGLDSLADATVGSAIGSILLADLAAVAGDRYNYGVGNNRVNLFVDEAAEVLNAPTIQLLNKGRGAGFSLTIATQTLADLEVRLGSEAAARQVLGNTNNMIVLRVLDGQTQKYIAENMPKTIVRTMEAQYRSGASVTDPHGFSAMYGEGVTKEEIEIFPPSLLGMLPNLHYLAKFANGRFVKGRLPILEIKE